MFKKTFFTIVFQGSTMLFAQTGILNIQVTDKMDGLTLEAASVIVENGDVIACKGMTDVNGTLILKNLAPGSYNVKTIYVGYPKSMITGVLVRNNETTYLDIELSSENIMDYFVITEYIKPLIDPNTSIKKTFVYDEIQKSPYTNINDFVATAAGAVQDKEGMTPHFRGCRSESVVYILDGQRMTGTFGIPRSSIQQMSVTLGGVPAMYGDATGAFIEIETRSGLVNPNK